MSTANFVPATTDEGAGNPTEIVRDQSTKALASQSLVRFRAADGFSLARSLAFQVVLTTIPGIILAVALAIRTGQGRYRDLLASLTDSAAPGPAGDVIRTALEQGADASGSNLAVVISAAVALLFSGTVAMAQMQRGASRIYGVENDRPTWLRYGIALILMVSSGILIPVAFLAFAVGQPGTDLLATEGAGSLWTWGRWPAGLLAVLGGITALYKLAPNRRQPTLRWLAIGSALAWIHRSTRCCVGGIDAENASRPGTMTLSKAASDPGRGGTSSEHSIA